MNTNEIEKRPIPGWDGIYSATSDGQIISEERTVKHAVFGEYTLKQKTLKPGLNSGGYLMAHLYRRGKSKPCCVHRLVGAAFDLIDLDDAKQQIDHIDNVKTNNRLENLRTATCQQNQAWGPKSTRADNTSGYRGVSWYKAYKKFEATIRFEGKLKHLGYFEDKLDAARAYDAAARELFGEFAFQNLSEGGQENA